MPTVSQPKPTMLGCSASHLEPETSGPGLFGPSGPRFRNEASSWARDSQPVLKRSQLPGWISPFSASQASRSAAVSR